MKKIVNAALSVAVSSAAVAAAVAFAGCTATQSVVKEFDGEGKVVRETVSKESVVKEITASTRNKTIVAWESGWAGYISVSTATQEDPTPTGKMFAGKTDKGVISALPDQKNWEGIADAIRATKYDLSVSSTGLSSTSADAAK